MFPVLPTEAELTDRFSHPPPPPEKPVPLPRLNMTQDEIIALRMSGGDYLDYRLKGLPDKERQAGITASEDSLYEAAMGMGNPMVALGSDPMRTFFGPFSVWDGAVGVYRSKTDMAYAAYNAAVGGARAMDETNDTYRHESIHRTIKILSDKYPELDKYRATDPQGAYRSGFGAGLEERIISQALGHTSSSDAAKMSYAKEFQELMETLDKLARKELMPQPRPRPDRPPPHHRLDRERLPQANGRDPLGPRRRSRHNHSRPSQLWP